MAPGVAKEDPFTTEVLEFAINEGNGVCLISFVRKFLKSLKIF